ncbi:MAG: methionyl-tRNA formyltransferase [Lachnospiraceae bacterium]|nr:methionyl-tRNA formyltransferase [Lachnospiraceae bacterium]MBR5944202.1 methionyl-tRNA formyltransferase [Lachnospiraceae bacterium]
MKIGFMGTPDFAVGALEKIIEAGHEVTLVVTQPDKEKGRGKELAFSPVKECALRHNIPVFQPVKIRLPENVEELKKYEADVFVVAAFGQILSKEILDMPRFGCINIHASLLPKYRGASPIAWSILNGDKETGVTIMQMNEGMDTGDILLQKAIAIDKKETTEGLFDKLMDLGAEMIVEALDKLSKGELTATPQDESLASKVGKMDKTFGLIDWNEAADVIERKIRGLYSWPSAYTFLNGKRLKIYNGDVVSPDNTAKPGSIIAVDKESFTVSTGDKALKISDVQIEGKRRMNVKEFLLGNAISVGDTL